MLNLIKIGGKVIDDRPRREAFLREFAAIGGPRILVHGGGNIATRMAARLGIETRLVEGRRLTTAEMMPVVTMVYGGLVSKEIVASLQSAGCNAVGICGADGNLIPARKRPVGQIDYGLAGDVDGVNPGLLTALLEGGFTPVVAPLTHDGRGQLLNTNADTIAAEVAIALSGGHSVQLSYCFEMPGVMADPGDPSSILPELSPKTFRQLKESGHIREGMLPKLDNAFRVLSAGGSVRIGCAGDLASLVRGEAGTRLVRSAA